MAKKKTTKKKQRPKHGQVWLAAQIGVKQPRVSELVKEGRIPRKSAYSKEDVERAKRMLDDGRAANNATALIVEQTDEEAIQSWSGNPERAARIKLIIERTAKLKLERELLSGGYVKKDDVQREWLARVQAVKAAMLRAAVQIALRLAGVVDPAGIERVVQEEMRAICNAFAAGEGGGAS